MLISRNSTNRLANLAGKSSEVFCSGLFLSARWFVVSQYDHDGIQMIVLPDKDSAEYCAADLYNLIEGDCVFFLPRTEKIARLEFSGLLTRSKSKDTKPRGKSLSAK